MRVRALRVGYDQPSSAGEAGRFRRRFVLSLRLDLEVRIAPVYESSWA
jgi:hypothetical protein